MHLRTLTIHWATHILGYMRRALSFTFLLFLLIACGDVEPRSTTSTTSPRPTSPAPATEGPVVEFDGTIHGWRVAPDQVLEAEFGNDLRNLDLDCDAEKVSPSTKTSLDIDLNYFPASAQERGKPTIVKWVCGSQGLSTYYNWSLKTKPFPVVGEAGELRIERVLTARRAWSIGTAPEDRVHECTIAGLPAVCLRNEQEGQVLILVIEDNDLDPYASFLLVDAFGLPFDELVKMIEGLE